MMDQLTCKEGKQGVSIGIGITGNCNFNCPHCYSKPFRDYSLTSSEVLPFLSEKNISSINYGTGASILNPDFIKIVEYCCKEQIKQSVTSNGYTILALPEEILRVFNDVDISLDFPHEQNQNSFRKGKSWEYAEKSFEKCRKNGIEFSIATALMNVNYKNIPNLLQIAKEEGCNLRLNVFKRVPLANIKEFELSFDEFWESMSLLFEYGNLISCSEPIVNAMLNIPPVVKKSPCGMKSLRVHPDGKVVPCVYWSDSNLHISNLTDSLDRVSNDNMFELIKLVPEYCIRNCEKVELCGGGCASRRYLRGAIEEPDAYCPIFRQKELPEIEVTNAKSHKDLVHTSYLCTLIFEGK